MDEPLPNLDLLDRVIRQIKAEPERWNQHWWVNWQGPGGVSRHCIGGWAIVLSGLKFDMDDTADEESVDGRNPTDVATELLGLTGIEASSLFISITDDWGYFEEVIAGIHKRYDLAMEAKRIERAEPGEETEAVLADIDRQFDELCVELWGLTLAELER